jgi:group I intron endonuclease
MGYIYKIINKITNQHYIGQTTKNLQERWTHHKKKGSNCRYLKYAFQKYGIDNFEFKLICICFDSDLNRFEIDYIKKYNSLVPNGYNLRAGGENGGKQNDETKLKISNSLKNRTDIIRGKPQLGKPHTDEVKQKISNSLKGRKINQEVIQKRVKTAIKFNVYKIDIKTGIILDSFNGYSEAAQNVGTTKNSIWSACNGVQHTSKGFIWKSELKRKSYL